MAERDYRHEYDSYQGTPEQIKNRAKRNKARRMKGLPIGDPREVDHERPLSKGGGNSQKNLHITSQSFNRHKGNNC